MHPNLNASVFDNVSPSNVVNANKIKYAIKTPNKYINNNIV